MNHRVTPDPVEAVEANSKEKVVNSFPYHLFSTLWTLLLEARNSGVMGRYSAAGGTNAFSARAGTSLRSSHPSPPTTSASPSSHPGTCSWTPSQWPCSISPWHDHLLFCFEYLCSLFGVFDSGFPFLFPLSKKPFLRQFRLSCLSPYLSREPQQASLRWCQRPRSEHSFLP